MKPYVCPECGEEEGATAALDEHRAHYVDPHEYQRLRDGITALAYAAVNGRWIGPGDLRALLNPEEE